jgi:FkbM family methyltransferase
MIDVSKFPPPRAIESLFACERIGVFGATGSAAEVESLLGSRQKKIQAYFDNAPQKQGTVFRGLQVQSPASAASFVKDGGAIVIAAAYQVEIAAQLTEMGIPAARIFPFVSSMFAPHFGRAAIEPHISQINNLLPRLADDASREYVENLIRFRWTMNPLDLKRNPKLKGFYLYDQAGLGPHKGDHLVDCGAYNGDTVKAFMTRLDSDATMTAVEPLSSNFEELKAYIASMNWTGKVTPVRGAVGEEPGETFMSSAVDSTDPRAHTATKTGEKVPVQTLDTLLSDAAKVDYVKIDIEGDEPKVLKGARGLLNKHKPDLAVAGYHLPEHLWTLPILLDSLQPGYKIFVGHHPSAPYECEFFCSARV